MNGAHIVRVHDVKEMRALPRIVADSEVGRSVPVLLWRDGKEWKPVTLNGDSAYGTAS